jgi:hypothetical protein
MWGIRLIWGKHETLRDLPIFDHWRGVDPLDAQFGETAEFSRLYPEDDSRGGAFHGADVREVHGKVVAGTHCALTP